MSEHPGLFLAIYECTHTYHTGEMPSFRRACYYTIYCDSPRHSPNQAKNTSPPHPVTHLTRLKNSSPPHPVTHLTRLKNSSPPHPLPATSLHLSITSSGSLQAPRAPCHSPIHGAMYLFSAVLHRQSDPLFTTHEFNNESNIFNAC